VPEQDRAQHPCSAPAFDCTQPGTVLAFDVGLRRTGVAVGNTITHTARALQVIALPRPKAWRDVDAIVNHYQPCALVVGLPLQLDGSDGPITTVARKFANRIRARYHVPVHEVDERHTSREAEREFRQLRQAGLARRKNASKLDSVAARRILERWLAGPKDDQHAT